MFSILISFSLNIVYFCFRLMVYEGIVDEERLIIVDIFLDLCQFIKYDSLLKLVSELKQTVIFSGFASLNDHVEQRKVEFNQLAEKTDYTLSRIGEEAAASLKH